MFCFGIILNAAIFGLRASRSHPAVLDRWEDSHSIWPVTVRLRVGVVLTTPSNREIWFGLVNQAQAWGAKEEIRGHPDRLCDHGFQKMICHREILEVLITLRQQKGTHKDDICYTYRFFFKTFYLFVVCQLEGAKINILVGFKRSLKSIEHQHIRFTQTPWTVAKYLRLLVFSPAALVKFEQLTGERLFLMMNPWKHTVHNQLRSKTTHSFPTVNIVKRLAALLPISSSGSGGDEQRIEKLSTYNMVTCLLYSTFF